MRSRDIVPTVPSSATERSKKNFGDAAGWAIEDFPRALIEYDSIPRCELMPKTSACDRSGTIAAMAGIYTPRSKRTTRVRRPLDVAPTSRGFLFWLPRIVVHANTRTPSESTMAFTSREITRRSADRRFRSGRACSTTRAIARAQSVADRAP